MKKSSQYICVFEDCWIKKQSLVIGATEEDSDFCLEFNSSTRWLYPVPYQRCEQNARYRQYWLDLLASSFVGVHFSLRVADLL